MSIDFRGQVIEAINLTDNSVEDKLAVIAALPPQITEGYFGASKAIVEGNESVANQINLLQATFLGVSTEPQYRMTEGAPLQRLATEGVILDLTGSLKVMLYGDTTRTATLVHEVERALPGCPVTTEPNGEGFSIAVSAKGRQEALALTEAIMRKNGFHAIDSRAELIAAL